MNRIEEERKLYMRIGVVQNTHKYVHNELQRSTTMRRAPTQFCTDADRIWIQCIAPAAYSRTRRRRKRRDQFEVGAVGGVPFFVSDLKPLCWIYEYAARRIILYVMRFIRFPLQLFGRAYGCTSQRVSLRAGPAARVIIMCMIIRERCARRRFREEGGFRNFPVVFRKSRNSSAKTLTMREISSVIRRPEDNFLTSFYGFILFFFFCIIFVLSPRRHFRFYQLFIFFRAVSVML